MIMKPKLCACLQ